MDKSPAVSVVIPTYNNQDGLLPILDALDTQTLPHDQFEVIFVDDSSTDGTPALLKAGEAERSFSLRVLRTPGNSGGPARPRNLGWRAANAPVVAFLDDDCVPEAGWLEAAVWEIESKPAVGVMQAKTITPPEVDLYALDRYFVYRLVLGPSPWFEATNIFYRKEALQAVGGFDERLRWWGEDTDLGWKVITAGWERGFCASATAVHSVERRGWRWWIRFGLREANVVEVASRYPQFRSEAFWRPWAMRRDDAAFTVALVAGAVAVAWPPVIVAALPYAWLRRPKVRQGRILAQSAEILVADAARFAGHIKGSLASRILVL